VYIARNDWTVVVDSQIPTPTLQSVVSELVRLEQIVRELAERIDTGFAVLGGKLDGLHEKDVRRPPQFPATAEAWERNLPDLFGSLLPSPLIPVCARLLIGMRAKEIAAVLGRPITTVKSQIGAIRDRLNLARSDQIPLAVYHRFWEIHAIGQSGTRQISPQDGDPRLGGY
jgi:hypothetical protein